MSKFKAIIEHLKYHLFMLRAEYSTLSFWLAKTISQSILFLAFFTTLYIISENKELRLEIGQLKVNQKELYLKIDQLEVTQGGLQQNIDQLQLEVTQRGLQQKKPKKKTIDNAPYINPDINPVCDALGKFTDFNTGPEVRCAFASGKVFVLSGGRIGECTGTRIKLRKLDNDDILADCSHFSGIVTISQ